MHPKKKAYIVAVDMGYGHKRATFPFLEHGVAPKDWHIEGPALISADDYPGIPNGDKLIWSLIRHTYEWFSRTSTIPIIGRYIFDILDYIQRIEPFYPKRDLSKPKMQTRQLYHTIENGHGKHLIKELNKNPLPLFTTFFVPAFFADIHGYKGPIYCLCTDTDISRAWAPMRPKKSKIIYCAPNERVRERLELYGVPREKIVLTGFPLPKEILGKTTQMEILRASLARRVKRLDPSGIFQEKYIELLEKHVGKKYLDGVEAGAPTITFAVGGAGAQAKLALQALHSLAPDIKAGKIRLNLVAGSSWKLCQKFNNALASLGIIRGVKIIYDPDKLAYFKEFTMLLRETDILWTKPSELSFYAGAGIPILIAPPLGSHEKCNRAWLHDHGAGIDQGDPRYASKWLSDLFSSGALAGAAINGFLKIPKDGRENIENLLFSNHAASQPPSA